MTNVAQQLRESRWINRCFLSATEKHYEALAFLSLMSWALAAPLTPLFLDHYYTYMISATLTSLVTAYIVCAKLLRRAAGLMVKQSGVREKFYSHPWHFFLAGMGIWSILSFLFVAEDKLRALKGGVNLKEGLTAYCFYAMLYAMAVLLTEERKRKAVQLTMVFGSIVPSLCFWLIEFGFTRYDRGKLGVWLTVMTNHRASIYRNSNYYGYYLTVILVLTAAYLVSAKKKKLQAALWCVFVLNVITLVVNDTLGAFVAVLAGLILIPVLYGIRERFRIRHLLPLVVFIALALWINFGVLWEEVGIAAGNVTRNYMSLRSDIGNLIAGNEAASHAGSGRWALWQVAWDVMLEHPLFGCGPEQMVFIMEERVSTPYAWPHNEYLQHAAALGIPAGLMYLAALITMAFTQIKRVKLLRDTTLIAGCVVVGYAVSAFFGGTTYVTAPYMFLALGLTSLRDYEHSEAGA